MGLRYDTRFRGLDGKARALLVYDDEYGGEAAHPFLSAGGLEISGNVPERTTEPIAATTARITYTDNGEFAGLSVQRLLQCRVELWEYEGAENWTGGWLEWAGYLSPEVYDVPVFDLPSEVTLNANSSASLLGRLTIPDGAGLSTFGELLMEAYDACGFDAGRIVFDKVLEQTSGYDGDCSQWRLMANRSLWATLEENDADETGGRTDWNGETWETVAGDMLRYLGLTLRECWGYGNYRKGALLLTAPSERLTLGRFDLDPQTFRSATARDYTRVTAQATDTERRALAGLEPGGTGNRTSLMARYDGVKVRAAITEYPTPAMTQAENQRTEILHDGDIVDMRMAYGIIGSHYVMSGQLRNCGLNNGVYGQGDLRAYPFRPSGTELADVYDLRDVATSEYVTKDDEGWDRVELGGGFLMRCTYGTENTVDQRKTQDEMVETLVLHATCGKWSVAGHVVPAGLVLAEWSQEGVTLTGRFAWSAYLRIFGNPGMSAGNVYPDEWIDLRFWWRGTDGVTRCWNGSGWTEDYVYFHPAFTRAASYPSATVDTVYPGGTEYTGLKGVVMEHGDDLPAAEAFGCQILKRGLHWVEDNGGDNDRNLDEAFVRDWEVGVGSDRNQYAVNKYTGEPKTEYNYKVAARRDSSGGTLEEDFPFHTWSRTQLCSSGLMTGEWKYETAQFRGLSAGMETLRHEVWLAGRLCRLYDGARRRWTLEARGEVPYGAVWEHEGKAYTEVARSFRPMDGVTVLTVDETTMED